MFEISWSEVMVLATVTLVFVGPKELPGFLRTLGRYAGVIKSHVSDFRAHLDEAIREVELDQMTSEVESIQRSVNTEIMSAASKLDDAHNSFDDGRLAADQLGVDDAEAEPKHKEYTADETESGYSEYSGHSATPRKGS